MKQDGEIPLVRAGVHKRAQALATLTPAGQLGTLGGLCLDAGERCDKSQLIASQKVHFHLTWAD